MVSLIFFDSSLFLILFLVFTISDFTILVNSFWFGFIFTYLGGLVVGWLGGGCGVGLGNAELNCLVCCGLSCCIVDMGGLVGGGGFYRIYLRLSLAVFFN